MGIDTKISNEDLALWADERVNLDSESAAKYRAQGDSLRTRLARYIEDHPEFDLVKMLNSGSVAKGTALRTTSDMDIAVYVRRASAPENTPDLVGWLKDRLLEAYGDLISPSQVSTDEASVRIEFSSSGVAVECVPVLYDGDVDDYGDVVLRNGRRVQTSIPKHLEFIRGRKANHPHAFAQLVRFIKYWRNVRAEERSFALGNFALELIVCHVTDKLSDPGDYLQALQDVFTFVVSSGLRQPIIFTDNYSRTEVPASAAAVRIFDPVAAKNNVGEDCSDYDRDQITEIAAEALDDLTIARTAPTKDAAIISLRRLFGPEFDV